VDVYAAQDTDADAMQAGGTAVGHGHDKSKWR